MLADDVNTLLKRIQSKWTAIGLNTEPVDRQNATEAVDALYASVNRPPPSLVWLRSPLDAVARYHTMSRDLGESISSRLPKAGAANLPDADGPIVWKWAKWYTIGVYDAYANAASDEERQQFDDFCRGEAMAESVTASVWRDAGKQVDEAVGFSRTFRSTLNTGSQLGDLGFHEFWWTYCGRSITGHPVESLMHLAIAAGWTLPFEQECWVVERIDVAAPGQSLLASNQQS